MNFFDEFWTQSEDVLKSIHNGVLADDKVMSDCIIYNNDMLEKFKNKIALNIIEKKYLKNNKQLFFEFKQNTNDSFLNEKIIVDFDKEILVMIVSAEIEQVIYSEILDCYFINLRARRVEKQFYSAAICNKKKNSERIKFCFLNEKHESIKINRPINNNEEY